MIIRSKIACSLDWFKNTNSHLMEGLRTVTDLAVPPSSTEARVLVKGEKATLGAKETEKENRSRGCGGLLCCMILVFFSIGCEINSRDWALERSDSPPCWEQASFNSEELFPWGGERILSKALTSVEGQRSDRHHKVREQSRPERGSGLHLPGETMTLRALRGWIPTDSKSSWLKGERNCYFRNLPQAALMWGQYLSPQRFSPVLQLARVVDGDTAEFQTSSA